MINTVILFAISLLSCIILASEGNYAFDRDTGLALAASSPGLTTFVCFLNIKAAKFDHLNAVYGGILENLPKLEHLKLWIETDIQARQFVLHHHQQAIQSAILAQHHNTLKTVQLKVPDVIIFVPKRKLQTDQDSGIILNLYFDDIQCSLL
ncbi:hypothetical protein BT96DRAFT_947046 [Gymnopus androsaceus JB14]|uniref:Inhibitor I9 domain-containing protein n=1 Tax=Gymnopus androsaceus JB14 TaxID=1447944 RepID=A0A6A4GUT4_9AGAR|nr:hypothetical protein BT96DRAFT_947046 [Gymnopus androsaceus JB14]